MSILASINCPAVEIVTVEPAPAEVGRAKISAAEGLVSLLSQANTSGIALLTGRPRDLPGRLDSRPLIFLDLSPCRSVIEHRREDQVISVQSGITCAQLDELLKGSGQWFPIIPSDPSMTLLELADASDGGALEHGFGGPRDLILGLEVNLASGNVIRCGGRVVKNVTGYDLQKLFIGSRGSLGVITAMHLRLYARPKHQDTLLWTFREADSALNAANRLVLHGLPLSCLELFRGPRFETGVETLAIQIHGHEHVVQEIADKAEELLGKAQQRLNDGQAIKLWSKLSGETQLRDPHAVEVSAPSSLLPPLLRSAGSANWQARPWRGRLKVFCGDDEQKEKFLLDLNQSGFSLTYAERTVKREYQVTRIPGDPAADRLKQELKEKFDPRQILNPLVLL